MPEFDKKHVIHSEGDGVLGDTTDQDVQSLVQAASSANHIVIHLHGGLVNKENGMALASNLTPFYKSLGTHPVFFVWETGLFETIENNLGQIVKEDVFHSVYKKVLKWVWGKTRESQGIKSLSGLDFPNDLDVELSARFAIELGGEDRWENLDFESVEDLTADEETAFVAEIKQDMKLNAALKNISEQMKSEQDVRKGAKGLTERVVMSEPTLMSPDIVKEIHRDEAEDTAKGIISWTSFARHVLKIAKRVIARYRRGRAHGLYTTIIEEVLYELYFVNVPEIGHIVWKSMKNDARETFEAGSAGKAPAGRLFWDLLSKEIVRKPDLKVSIVAHSAGAIFASHMLGYVGKLINNGQLPANFAFKDVIFLAPAIRSDLLAGTLRAHSALIGNFRMFTMTDDAESGYWEVPGYKGSLLYMVSGLFEKGGKHHDVGIAGMARYIDKASVYNSSDYQELRDYFLLPGRAVWSPNENQSAGFESDSEKHGAFDEVKDGAKTMQSVFHILSQG